jgi:aryl-alcohol dehydrogenase
MVPGHEGSGIVESVGSRVTEFAPGDKVCMSFSYCNECYSCVTGRPYECEKNGLFNFGGRCYDGTTRLTKDGVELSNFFNQSSFATYSVTHRNNLVKVPDDMDLRLTGPLGCGLQTGAGAVLNYLKPEPGSSIVIVGCGAVGLRALMAAKISGCAIIIAVDAIDSRLELAQELGATHIINAAKTDTVAAARDITKGRGANYAFNATGSGKTARTAIECTDLFGNIAVLCGDHGGELGFMASRVVRGITEGLSIPGLFIPQLIRFYQEGLYPFDKLVEFYAFEDINQASADSLSGKTIKPILLMDN